jgi:xylan 1,4-beta-xylosidase
MMKHSLELEAEVGVKLGGLLTWAFTFPGTPYFAGYRALATNGINLPVMSAFKLLGHLGGTRMPLTSSGARPLDDILTNGVRGEPDIDGLATLNGPAVQVLVWNYHDDIVTAAATPVHLAVTVPASFGALARVSHLRLDDSHGDAYTLWVSQGMPASPSASQIVALQGAMDPSLLAPDRTGAVAADGSLGIDFDLPRFGVSLVTFQPSDVAIDGGTATDGSVVSGGDSGGGNGGSGCGCRLGGRGDGAASSAATLLGLGAMVIGMVGRRRRSARCSDRT